MLAAQEIAAQLQDEQDPIRATILIVDDKKQNRTLLARILQTHYYILFASNGEEAIEAIQQYQIDMVLLDIVMDKIDGLKTLEILRSQPQYQNIAIILVSALADNDLIARGLNMGANDYIAKPINSTIVRARVRNQLKMKQLLDENDRVIDELRRIQNNQSRLMSMATHDLRHPITNIKMAEMTLRQYMDQNPESANVIDGMLLAINSMNEVFEDFLNAFTMTNLRLDHAPVIVGQVISNVLLQYQFSAMGKDITLTNGTVDGVVTGDGTRLEQAISNLLSNAIKYSPPQSEVKVWTEIEQQHVIICVRDQGPGIPEQERRLLFTEFGKLSTQPTGNETSIGLGLWIVKQLIDAMGGQVGAEFPAEGGSTFWVALPQAEE